MQANSYPVAVVADSVKESVRSTDASSTHHDQYVQYSHQMTEETAESAACVLTRLVPLVYGALLGWVIGNLLLGLLLGAGLAIALDLRMGEKSLARPLVFRGCPLIAWLARSTAVVLAKVNVHLPASLRSLRCSRA